MYDITILYTRNGHGTISNQYKPPTLLDIFASAEPITVIVYVKIRSVSRILQKKKLEKYLEHLWIHKEKVISQLKAENDTHIQSRILKDNFSVAP